MSANERAREMSGKTVSTRQYRLLLTSLIAALLVSALVALCIGRYEVRISTVVRILLSKLRPTEASWEKMQESVVMNLRLPRVIGAILVGSALSLSGASYQGVFKNPLVAPDLLGVSSGACVGASIAILAHTGPVGIQTMAFLFGMLTVGLTVLIPRLIKNNSITMLVLAGVIVSGIMSSIMGIIKYIADPETELASITYWQMGSLAKVTLEDLPAVAIPIV